MRKLPDGDSVCHADFHPKNVMISESGLIVIDWVHAMRGNFHADVANTLLGLRPRNLKRSSLRSSLAHAVFRKIYLREYLKRNAADRNQISAFLLPVAVAHLGEDLHGDSAHKERWMQIVNDVLSDRIVA